MKSSLSTVLAAAMVLSGCGGGGTSPGGPPSPPPPVPHPTASGRAAIQSVLLGLQFATVHVGGFRGTVLSARRVTSRVRTPRDVACTGGFSEKDTATVNGVTHRVVSLYYDPQCSVVRQVATLDDFFGVDTTSLAGSAVAYDRNGLVTGYQTLSVANVLGLTTLQTTDALAVGGTPFARTNELCLSSACTAAATINSSSFETAATLSFTLPAPGGPPTGSLAIQAVTYAGAPGSLTVSVPQFDSTPAITGGQPVGGLSATYALSVANFSVTTLSLDATGNDGTRFSASLSNGVTTITASGGISATIAVDANGNGAITYSDGSFERVVDYRDVG